jgi:hypothetical protein
LTYRLTSSFSLGSTFLKLGNSGSASSEICLFRDFLGRAFGIITAEEITIVGETTAISRWIAWAMGLAALADAGGVTGAKQSIEGVEMGSDGAEETDEEGETGRGTSAMLSREENGDGRGPLSQIPPKISSKSEKDC